MKYLTAMIVWLVLTGPAGQAIAADAYEGGMPGMKWGAAMSGLFDLKEVSEQGEVRYYVKNNEDFTINGITPQKVVYGFYKDRFFAAFFDLGSKEEFDRIRKYLTNLYGPARAQLRVDRTDYIWSYNDLKVKMKSDDKTPRFKVGFYYAPISEKVNENRVEAGFEKVIPLK